MTSKKKSNQIPSDKTESFARYYLCCITDYKLKHIASRLVVVVAGYHNKEMGSEINKSKEKSIIHLSQL